MTKAFLTDTAVRVLRTFLQAFVGALGLDGADVIHASWTQALAVAGSAAFLAVLTAFAATPAPVAPQDAPQDAPVK
ncbi:holin [Streptomyces sp. NBC_01180]|uniref:holin n=1 Tax=Streptomyces sp. NBC_01180 TaxID=2903763 RepID=UPI003867A551|nr:holin [Streptomyces sp. NBC_01180]